MATLGLVRRETDPRDRRRNQLFVTDQAEPTVAFMQDARDGINTLVLDLLGEQQATQLTALLSRFLEELDRSEAALEDDSADD